MKDKDIIYIAGNVRSGSTLLERIISSNNNILGLGELSHLLKVDFKNTTCSCSEKLNKCPYWKNIIENIDINILDDKIKDIQLKNESLFSFPKFLFDKDNEYKIYCKKIIDYIFDSIPNDIDYIVDSSKSSVNCFFRPYLINKYCKNEIKVIHLVRDGRGCMYSHLKRFENSNLQAIKASLKWLIANISANMFAINSNDSYIRIKYENLVKSPIDVLKKLSIFLDTDISESINIIRTNNNIPFTHQFKANPMRNKSNLKINKEVGFKWKNNIDR